MTIVNQSRLPDEIIIVDDGSRDETFNVVTEVANTFLPTGEKLKDKIQILYNYLVGFEEPRISCVPRNTGWKDATGDVIIFTEPEALQIGNTIEKLLATMEKFPENTILASQVWTLQEKVQADLEKAGERYFLHPEEIITHPYAMITSGTMQNTNAPNSDWAISGELNCNAGVLFATRKEWLEKIGGFDESFFGHGFDDFDLFARLQMIGHGIVKDPGIGVIHMWHKKDFYPYNIYECAENNGKISEANVKAGKFKVNG